MKQDWKQVDFGLRQQASLSPNSDADCQTMKHVLGQEMIDKGDSTQIRFLGTGCAEPSKYRSASAIHVQLKNGRGILLDAGEGSYGQMVRYYGNQEARQQVRSHLKLHICHSLMSRQSPALLSRISEEALFHAAEYLHHHGRRCLLHMCLYTLNAMEGNRLAKAVKRSLP